jgi:hypothetical protein
MRFEAGKEYKTKDFTRSELDIITEIRKWLLTHRGIDGNKLIDTIPYMFSFDYDVDGCAYDWAGGRDMDINDHFRNTFTLSMIPGEKTILCNFDCD